MSLDLQLRELNEFLQVIEEANDGCNHLASYSLDELPIASTLTQSLALYYSGQSTSRSPPQPAERWDIRIMKIEDAETAVRKAAYSWFYDQEFSPRPGSSVVAESVSGFFDKLQNVIGDSNVYEVQVKPPMFYDLVWQDFAFDGRSRWLLHLGFSD